MKIQSSTFLLSLFALLVFVHPAEASTACDGITIDNDPSDWAEIDSIVSDDQDVTGLTYYYNGTSWSTEASDADIYSTDILSMQDLQVLKVCNSATQLQLYIDNVHPLLSYLDMESGHYFEFGDETGPDGTLGLPADLNFWLVFKMKEIDGSKIYYYAIHFDAAEGDLGLENGPSLMAIYKEIDDVAFSDATFDPNSDELVVEIQDDSKAGDSKDGGKNVDPSGGFETDVPLLNSDGTGFFNVTNIQYGNTLKMSVATYPGSQFEGFDVRLEQAGDSISDETSGARYKIKKSSVLGLTIPDGKRTAVGARAKWDELSDASAYQVRLFNKNGEKLLQEKTTTTHLDFVNLTSEKNYQVKVRAKIGTEYTSWSDAVEFKTR